MTEELNDGVNHEQALRDRYKPRLSELKPEELQGFIDEVMNDPDAKDYGGICVAIGLVAAGAAWAMNRHENGGITGFQAGFVFWEFMRNWGSPSMGESGTRIVNFDDLLYPQYAEKFAPTVSESTWKKVQELAQKKIDENTDSTMVHPSVYGHWESILEGRVPFGLTVTAD